MASIDPNRRHSISEVSELVNVPIHVLRQWEDRIPELRIPRDRSKRRYYTGKEIRQVQRIRQLLWDEKMTTAGARKVLAAEARGETPPRTTPEMLQRIDAIEADVRALLERLDEVLADRPGD